MLGSVRHWEKFCLRRRQNLGWDARVSDSAERSGAFFGLAGVWASGQHGAVSMLTGAGVPDDPGDARRKSHVTDRVLVLRPGVRPIPLRWESQVQDIGPPGTSQLHVISNGESSPRYLHLNAKTQLHSTTSKLQCWTPYAKKLARQERNPTH